MQSGYNTDTQHQGLLFHVQTEDSGRAKARILTQLFYAGQVIATQESRYTEYLGAADLQKRVRVQMQKQHQTLLQQLRTGRFDAVIRERVKVVTETAEETAATSDEAMPLAASESAAATIAVPAAQVLGVAAALERRLDEFVFEFLVERAAQRSNR